MIDRHIPPHLLFFLSFSLEYYNCPFFGAVIRAILTRVENSAVGSGLTPRPLDPGPSASLLWRVLGKELRVDFWCPLHCQVRLQVFLSLGHDSWDSVSAKGFPVWGEGLLLPENIPELE